MRWDEIYVAGTGVALPPEVTVEAAIAAGRYDRERAANSRQLAATVAASTERSPDFAIRAAQQALTRSGHAGADVGLLLHGVVFHDGIDAWNAASYVQRQVASERCIPIEIRMVCNTALIGIELACSHLRTHQCQPAAVITASDCWSEPFVDRWGAPGFVLGDGGAALVLSRQHGFARLLATAIRTDPEIEGLTRGAEPFGPFRHSARNPIDLRRRAQEFLRDTMPVAELWRRRDIALRSVVEEVTGEFGIDPRDVEHAITPFLDHSLLSRECLEPLGLDIARTTWEYGRRIGHMGAADHMAALNHLAESRQLAKGDRVLIIGVGGGYTWCAALLEVIQRPGT